MTILASSSYTITNLIDGKDGQTPVVHTAYANSADGRTDFSLTVSDGKRYIGQYTDYVSADSTDPTKYKWVDMAGGVESGGRNYFKNSRSMTYTITSDTTQDYKTFIYDEFWKNDRRFIKSMVRISLDIAFSPALPQDISTRAYFGRSPWYSAPITFKGNTTDRQHFDLVYDLGGTTNTYKADNVFIRFNNSFPLNTRVSIDNANLYISSVREDYKPAPEDTDAKIDTKMDEEFTIEQLNLIAENQRLLKAENDAKASLEELNTWVNTIKEQLEAQKNGQRISEEALIEASTRVTQIQAKLGEIALVTEAITQYMSYSENGLIIGMKDGTSSVRVTTDRISFYSGGTETAFISQGFLQIESGVFTLRLQIGHYLFEEDANGMLMIGRVI